MSRTATISLRIDPEKKQRLEDEAAKDDRTLSYYIEKLLDAHLEELSRRDAKGKKK